MSDPYASIADIDEAIQARLVDVLELRAADLRQQEMLESYLSEINPPAKTKALCQHQNGLCKRPIVFSVPAAGWRYLMGTTRRLR